MKRLIVLAALAFALTPSHADAGTPVYAGNLQVTTNANLSFLNGGSGCLLVNNGVAYIAACPVGTVAFSAASPFQVTGSGPYVIQCPTCFTTAGGTITGATTFSSNLTVNGALTGTAGSFNTQYTVSSPTSASFAYQFKDASSRYVAIGYNCGTVGTVTAVEFSVNVSSLGCLEAMDASGNAGFLGQVTATQFNVGSRREWKYDIHPLPFDALQVLHDTDFATFRYRPDHGDPRLPHVGIIADDSPSVLSGEKHDHLDIEALATVDAKATLQLESQINVLYIILATLTILVLLLVVALGLVWRDKTAG